LRRSLATFMNAMTRPEVTYYPFSTQNEQDFNNLLNVYLDSVFFPKISELDFKQEGHRLEYVNANEELDNNIYNNEDIDENDNDDESDKEFNNLSIDEMKDHIYQGRL